MRTFLSIKAAALLLGIDSRVLRKRIRDTLANPLYLYRGSRLIIRTVKGKGGKSGLSYEIAADSLPVSCQLALRDSQDRFERPARHDEEALRWQNWKSHHLAPIASLPPRSKERGRAIAEFASKSYIGPDHQVHTFTDRTIRQWLKNLDATGLHGLTRKKRNDAGKSKVIVTREFDNAAREAGIDDAQLHLISEKLQRYVRSLIAADATFSKIKFLAEGKLNQLAASAGIATDGNRFKVPDHLIRMHRQFKAVARFHRDAKAHQDASPHITRTIAGLLPMDIVIGDIHPVDIVMRRADGSTATARLIGWMDVATHRVFSNAVLCESGTGIRNSHVVQSFMDMVRAWGLPRSLYLDNGKEYGFADLLGDVLKLTNTGANCEAHLRFAGDGNKFGRVIRAQPYNAQAKGLIEGGFRNLEVLFRDTQGYIGGNRLLKKSANVGRPPLPFGGTLAELQNALAHNLRLYNGLPQRGQLNGRSPDEAFADLVEAGWTKTVIDEQTLMLAFTTEEQRPVRNGFISYGGKKWTCDELQAYHGKTVTALIPKYERWNGIPLHDEKGQLLGIAREEQAFEYLDIAGAEEAARRKKLFKDGVKSLELQTDKIDTHQELADNIHRLPVPVRAPVGTTIGGTYKAQKIIAGLEETPAERAIRKQQENDREVAERLALIDELEEIRKRKA